jgi:hypothetical protein
VTRDDVLEERLLALNRCIEQGEHRARRQQACVDRLLKTGDDARPAQEALRLTHQALDCLYISRAMVQDWLGTNELQVHQHLWRSRTAPHY